MNNHEAFATLADLMSRKPVLVTGKDASPSGVTDLAALGLASHRLAVELAAKPHTTREIADVLGEHDTKNGDSAYAVLIGAVQSLLLTYLEPAMRALDGQREFDLRAHAMEAWKTLEKVTGDRG